jgi:hypothetical protein
MRFIVPSAWIHTDCPVRGDVKERGGSCKVWNKHRKGGYVHAMKGIYLIHQLVTLYICQFIIMVTELNNHQCLLLPEKRDMKYIVFQFNLWKYRVFAALYVTDFCFVFEMCTVMRLFPSRFRYQPCQSPSWRSVRVISSVPPDKYQDWTSVRPRPRSSKFFWIYRSSAYPTLYILDTVSIVKQPTKPYNFALKN